MLTHLVTLAARLGRLNRLVASEAPAVAEAQRLRAV